jgi:glycoside hydrolase-like protein
MNGQLKFAAIALLLLAGAGLVILFSGTDDSLRAAAARSPATQSYLGFDRNEYPGDAAMKTLRHDFAFTSFWLSPPPGDKTGKNTWTGKREFLRAQGFGFVVLYRGRDAHELKTEARAKELGTMDARNAASSAKTEGFSAGTIIFLDIEDGGRLPAAYHSYLRAFADELAHTSFRAGLYCSGIPVKEGSGSAITTTEDIRTSEAPREFVFWAYNDACPPSPGCVFPQVPPAPTASGTSFASVWQFAQSPRRKEFAAHCPPGYHTDGNCYAPSDTAHLWFLDVNSSSSPDPSGGSK